MSTIAQLIKSATQSLAESSDSARLDAEVLLCHVLNCTATHLFAWPEKIPNEEQVLLFDKLTEQRLTGTPIAYLVGHKEFWSLDFKVSTATLIPRPDTETLVEYVLDTFPKQDTLSMIDLGTGSGAIAIAIASERPNWEITATDISTQALTIARGNACQHQINNVTFIESHWFEQIEQQFDLIVSNPPYIAEQDPHLCQGDVRFEPVSALASGKIGMDDIERIASHAMKYLKKDGCLIFEHGYDQKTMTYDCLHRFHYQKITQLNDLSGQPRISLGYYHRG